MAYVRSGSFLTGKNGLGDLEFKLSWAVQSQDWYDEDTGEEDIYYITWNLKTTADSNFERGLFSSGGYYGLGRLRILMNGLTIYDKNTNPAIDWVGEKEVATHGVIDYTKYTVQDSGDCPISFRVIFDYSQDGASIDASASWELPPYFRPAKFYYDYSPSFTDKKPLVLQYTNPAGNRVSKLQAKMYLYEEETDETITVAEYRDIPKTSSTTSSIIKYDFDLEGYELQKIWNTIPYTKSRTVYVQIRTEEVNSEFDTYDFFTQEAYFTLVDEPPAFPYTEVADILEKTVALTGGTGMIKKYNKMSYKIDALPRKGAIITSQSMVVQGKTYTANEGTIDNLETNVFTFYATDSRGLTSSHTITVPMIEYFAPTVEQDLKITLDAAGGEAAKIEMSVEGTIFYSSFGAKNNTIKLEVRHTDNEGVMGDWVDLTVLIGQVGSGTYSMNTTITGLRYDRDYVFQSRITDALNTVETTEYKITLKPVFDWGRDSFNFNVPITADNIARVYATYTLSDTITDGVVELVDNMNNYDYIEILFTDNNGRGCGVAKFIPPGFDEPHTIDLFLVEASGQLQTLIRRTAYICYNNRLTPTLSSANYATINNSSAGTYAGEQVGKNHLRVVRVLGYK